MDKFFYEWGNRDHPTLVFMHGVGATGLSFGDLAQYLMSDFHVVSFDLPGHGGAAALDEEKSYRSTQMAKWIKEKLDLLGLSEIYLGGHSWGAHLALYVAGLYPESITGLVLLDGGYFQQNPDGESEDQVLKNVEAFHESVRFPSQEAFLESEKAESPRWSQEIEAAALDQVTEIDGEIRLVVSPFTAKAIIKGIDLEPTAKIFAKVQSPALLLRSTLPNELEGERQKAIKQLIEGVPQAKVQSILNTSHDIYRDAPEKVTAKIKEWIQLRLNE
ncbi:alpha/beta hydrolase [Virgibacillus siamensis]|uniref:Alpha/beta hydrolase n=1 Tax=Virgibacillus siamensis TaxID=480071 RepID=A0ABP3QM88_9BACI